MREIRGEVLKAGILGAYQNLENQKEMVNELNVYPVPDGDTGTNMTLTMRSASKYVSEAGDSIPEVVKALGTGSLMGARGNSGVILSQLCRGVSTALGSAEVLGLEEMADAFEEAAKTAYKAVMKPTEGTILTVARKMAEFAQKHVEEYDNLEDFLSDVMSEGNRTLEKTPEMLPQLKEAGVVDAGGKGLLTLLEGFYNVLFDEDYKPDTSFVKDIEKKEHFSQAAHKSDADIKFGYCTEFFIKTNGADYMEFRREIEPLGDSIVCIGMDDVIKTHIHTNNPGKVLELALKRGYLMDIKIDNMRLQHEHLHVTAEELEHADEEEEVEEKDYGFVAVSMGEGFDEVFRGLEVDQLISGGQTMNPSTEDIVHALEKVHAKDVFVLPNNKNIILSAESAAELVTDKNVHVLPTRTIPQGFAALFAFDETSDVESNLEEMESAIQEVKTGQITYAVRDTEVESHKIQKDDFIGLLDGKIAESGKELEGVMMNLLDDAVQDENSLITLYYGSDVKEEDAEALLEKVEEKYPEMDVELVDGQQPIYFYVFSVEA